MKDLKKFEWRTARGEVLTFEQMEPSHLLNVCRFIKRGIDTDEAFGGEAKPHAHEALAAALAVARQRGLLTEDGRVPTFQEQQDMADAKLREKYADDPVREMARRGVRPIDVEE